MQITRQQEIDLWKLLAASCNLKDRGNNKYRGTCPFCDMPRLFQININKNYAECLACGKGGLSLVNTINSLISSSSSAVRV